MRLCIVSPFPPEISGIGQYGWNVAYGLARTGRFEAITVLTGSRDQGKLTQSTQADGITTRWVWKRDDVSTVGRLTEAIQREHPQVVWFNLGFTAFGRSRVTNFAGLATPMLTRQAGLSTVVTLHEIFEASPPRALGAVNGRLTTWGARAATRCLLRAHVVCVTLQRYQQELKKRYGADNVRHVPHGSFAAPEFLPPPTAPTPPTLLIFATFAPYKGLPILLEAFERLKRVNSSLELVIAGSDHPRFPGYLAERRAAMNGMRGLHWLGQQTEAQLREVFARATIVVLPYTATTGASSVLHRAAAYGRPVVASDLPDIRAVADEEGLQLVYAPPADPSALAEALARLLADPAERGRLAQHNLQTMRLMSLDHTCARYVEVFERIVGQGGNQ